MTYLITFLENNRKSSVYTGGEIHGIYRYLDMIGDPTKLTTSGQRSNHFGPSSPRKNYTATLQPVIAALSMRQKSICECCGIIGNKYYTCTIRGPKFLPPCLRRKMNNFNTLSGEEPKEPPREWNSQPPEDHFKSRTSTSRTNPVILAIMGKLNHNSIDNGDVNIPNSDVPVESNYDSVPDIDTTPIKSIDDDEMDNLLEFFHSEHDDNIIDVDLQMIQA